MTEAPLGGAVGVLEAVGCAVGFPGPGVGVAGGAVGFLGVPVGVAGAADGDAGAAEGVAGPPPGAEVGAVGAPVGDGDEPPAGADAVGGAADAPLAVGFTGGALEVGEPEAGEPDAGAPEAGAPEAGAPGSGPLTGPIVAPDEHAASPIATTEIESQEILRDGRITGHPPAASSPHRTRDRACRQHRELRRKGKQMPRPTRSPRRRLPQRPS